MPRPIIAVLVASILAPSAAAEIVEIPAHMQFLQCAAASEVLSMRRFSLQSANLPEYVPPWQHEEVELYLKASVLAHGFAKNFTSQDLQNSIMFYHFYDLRPYTQDAAELPDEYVDATRRMCAENYRELALEVVNAFHARQ